MNSEAPWHIPKHWIWTRLKSVGNVVAGGTPSTKEPAYWSEDINWISPADLTGYTQKTIACGAKGLSKLGLQNSSAKVMPAGSVHFSSRAPIGYVVISAAPMATNQGFKSLVPMEGVINEYVYYFLKASKELARKHASGTTFLELSGTAFGLLPVPLPPTNEQYRIVAKIEELFSELDKGVENLKAAREKLNVYRLSVLDQATGGAQSIDYATYILGDLIGPIQQGWSPKCDPNRQPLDNEWAIIKTTAIQPMQYIPHECKPLPETLEPRSGIEVRDGDLLMTRKGPRPRTGVVCFVKKARPRSMLCDTVYRFRANEDLILPQYLEIALNAPRVLAEINEKKSGISDSGISLNHGRIKSVRIPIPADMNRQRDVIASVEQKLSVIANIELELDQQFEQSEVLRQAILKTAFSGQLVAQDTNDEPASALLERINAEKVEKADGKFNKRKDAV